MSDEKLSDHDLLVTLHEQVKNIRGDIKDLKDGTAFRISCLEKDKADRNIVEELQNKVNKDFEIRVRELEQIKKDNRFYIKGLAAIGLIIISMLIWHMTGYKI